MAIEICQNIEQTVGEMLGDRILKPAIPTQYRLVSRHKNLALRDLFPKSLASNMFQPDGDMEARTPDPYNAIVETLGVDSLRDKASSFR